MSPPNRPPADACPGVVATHEAADGALARVRVPGGVLTSAQARALAAAAEDIADGDVHLTSRGNLQLRGVRDAAALARDLGAAGLLPSATHERVRNILASPLSGVRGGRCDVRPLVPALDGAVCARADLADLPGRFLFALDDGRGDVAAEDPDVCWQAVDAGGRGVLLLGGVDSGLRIPVEDAVPALVAAAAAFTATRGTAWRVRELPHADRTGIAEAVRALATHTHDRPRPLPRAGEPEPGPLTGRPDVVVAAPPFGTLPAAALRTLADSATGPLVVTPWRTLVVPGVPADGLAALGFAVSPDDPRARVSACIGAPGCAKSWADVRGDTRAALAGLDTLHPGVRAHVSGCERRCGRPRGEHVDVLATGDGYRVDGTLVPVAALTDRLKGRS